MTSKTFTGGHSQVEFDHLVYESRYVDYLAKSLVEGTLVVVLGAGASAGAGLPDWAMLVKRLTVKAGLTTDEVTSHSTADELQRLADEVKRDFCRNDERVFADLVRECLYDGVVLSPNLVRTELLESLGALMTGSRRGSVRRILSYNFDSNLEWYLHLHGIITRVIVRPPALEGAEDVRIYHPHGFLPHPDFRSTGSDFVLLGLQAANLRLGTAGDPWFELVRHLLRTGVGLVVGMSLRSFRDRSIAPLLSTVGSELRESRPTAFWLVDAADSDACGTDETTKELLDSNVVPIFWRHTSDVPNLLYRVCRQAAAAVGA